MVHGVRKAGRFYPLSQAALAQRAHVSVGCLQTFERGTRRTTGARLHQIAAACELTVDQLLAPDDAPRQVFVSSTREASAIADMFLVAVTEVRGEVKRRLHVYCWLRRDDPTVATILAVHRPVLPAAPTRGDVLLAEISESAAQLSPSDQQVILDQMRGLADSYDGSDLRPANAVAAERKRDH
jgi:transcriptional regulator with XRE-family HTH domain